MYVRKKPIVQVAVYDFNNNLISTAEVTIKSLRRKPEQIVNLEFDKQWQQYRAYDVTPGYYLLQAKAEGFETDQRKVKVDPSGLKEVFILGKKDMLFLYRGKTKVPIDPPRDLLGISVKFEIFDKREEELKSYALKLNLKSEEVGEQIKRSNVRVFRFPENINDQEKKKIQKDLSEHPLVEFIGPIIRIDKESLSFLTNDLIIKFKSHISKEQVPEFAKRFNLSVVRHIPYAGNTYQFRIEGQVDYEILKLCEEIMKTGMVENVGPDLFSTIIDDQINPNDFLHPEQWDHQLFNTPGAWQILSNLNSNLTYGSPDIIIAVVDRGIEANHPDFSGNVTNGNPKIYELYDFRTMQPNNNILTSSHGMGCAGAATAQANNPSPIAGQDEGVVGIAGNCRLIGVRRPAGPESAYSDMYIWLAGFDPNSATLGFPQPISPGADIITSSFGYSFGFPPSPLMSDTFDFLTTYGRDGKGVLLFFSVGNYFVPQDFTQSRPWAAYEKTFAIAASTLANDGVTEEISAYSGFSGLGVVDLCAPSHDEYIGGRVLHNPPQNYGAISCDRIGQGNMPGYARDQTTLTQNAGASSFTHLTANANMGGTTLNVNSNVGFAVNQFIRLGQHGIDNAEWVRITAIPPGNVQLTVTALANNHDNGTLVFGTTNLNVNNNAGFQANQWLLLGQPGQVGTETVLIHDIPAGNTSINVAGPLNNHAVNTPVIGGPNDCRNTFGGTSYSTPVCAGVAALMLSANPDLTWVQLRHILRDTAEHIDLGNANPIGQWLDTDGDGVVDYSRWYGFGRVDAQRAVQEAVNLIGVSPLNNIDTWIMENSNDVGDVPSMPPYSPDVWVRNTDPILDNPAQINQHQSPIRGQDNWVYFNVRNRGSIDSHDVYVRIFITRWAGTQYIYPDDFIPTNPPGTDPVQPLEAGTYLIGEVHIDTIPSGGVITNNIIWEAALIPPASVVIDGVNYSWADACLLVDVSPHDGPTPTGSNTWDNNNLCQKNVFPVDPAGNDDFAIAFVVGHRMNNLNLLNLRIERKYLPADVDLYIDYLNNGILKEILGFLDDIKNKPYTLNTCDLTILNEVEGEILCSKTGEIFPVIISPKTRLTLPCCQPMGKPIKYQLYPVLKNKRTFLGIPTIQKSLVPILRKRGEYQIVALHGKGLTKLKKGKYQIDIYQEDLTGKIEGCVNFIIYKK